MTHSRLPLTPTTLMDEADFIRWHHQQTFDREDWWLDLPAQSTPVWTRLPDRPGWGGLHFYWCADQEPVPAQVCIEVDSHTVHPLLAQTLMHRLAETRVWYWRTELPLDWLGSYQFIPLQFAHQRPQAASGAVLRQWWQALLAQYAQADNLNPYPAYLSSWGREQAQLIGPAAQSVVKRTQSEASRAITLNLREACWESPSMATRYCYSYGAISDFRVAQYLVLHLDGQLWQNMPGYLTALAELHQQAHSEPALHVLLASGNSAQRARDYGCSPQFIYALAQEFIPHLRQQLALTEDVPVILCGQSLGGLCAVYAALSLPEQFPNVLALSGSYWWPDVANEVDQGMLAEMLKQRGVSAGAGRFWLAAGDEESDMRERSRVMVGLLQQAGYQSVYHEFRGGHDRVCWREAQLQGLASLLQGVGPRPLNASQ